MASLKFGQGVRRFSTTVMKHQMVKPPVQVYGVEGRYASALYSAASKKKALDAVEKDLSSLSKALSTDIKLKDFLYDPTQKVQDKKVILKTVADKGKYSEMTTNLFGAMADNGRLNKLGAVADSFSTIMAAERGLVSCTVTVAKTLDAATQKELTKILSGFLKKGESLQLSMKVDPAVIGGMRVDFADKSVDMAMSSKLGKYATIISEAL
ncbi:ATP synthase subunit O, mitochondrial-like [Pecten maximus]|uniref:ATP synthase subunit O, mitochondrial-like n=1 Tax=Pecten maximus TaxID=6579 RepID=UPI0014590929|nr:ATP synthase subunit O, mitochondrial-like [Pecten maximus]